MFRSIVCFRQLALALFFVIATVAQSYAAVTTVREPKWDFPHIYGDTDLEVAYENGREIARDRLAQIILLGRAGRGTLAQAFGGLDPGIVDDDIVTRQLGYTSSELQSMISHLTADEQAIISAYCDGVNDTIDEILDTGVDKPLEISILEGLGSSGLKANLFGNATNISDQIDPDYRAPGGADPQRPDGGYQFTPEIAMAIGILEVRNFGLGFFDEIDRLGELIALQAAHGASTGEEIWRDLNFLVDPLAPSSVPDSSLPGYGGPLAALDRLPVDRLPHEQGDDIDEEEDEDDGDDHRASDAPDQLTDALAAGVEGGDDRADEEALLFASAGFDYEAAAAEMRDRHQAREENLKKWGAWPALGSYMWVISAAKSATGNPWLGGFPQTGIMTPSIMHFAENRSGETMQGIGMEFAGGPYILIGQTDTVAYTSTTAQLRVIDTVVEEIVGEDADAIRYDDEGSPAPLSMRTETVFTNPDTTQAFTFWRSHERGGNGGSRPIVDFLSNHEGVATGGNATTLTDSGASFGPTMIGGHVAIIEGTGAGQIRAVSGQTATSLTVGSPWTTAPDSTSGYVAVDAGGAIQAVAQDSSAWLEESQTVVGFSELQKAGDILDVRSASRRGPTTHNFPAADNGAFNGIGTDGGRGNIAFYTSGFARKRGAAATDLAKLIPIDGRVANPLVVASGTVTGASPSTLTDTGAFAGEDYGPDPINFRDDNPSSQGAEFLISITAGTGYKQTRRIASNDDDTVTVEHDWGTTPAPGDSWEIYEILGFPESINPAEGYLANWNNKSAQADDGDGFGRNHRVAFILERLAADDSWDRDKQRQLNKDVAGLDGKGQFGRYLVPRLQEAVAAVGNGGNPDVDTVLAALVAHNGAPDLGRYFNDPVTATTTAGEVSFLNSLISQLSSDIFGDELAAVGAPGGSRGLAMVLHAIDSAAGDVPGSYSQVYAGDYFNGSSWETVVRDSLSALASGGIPADGARPGDNYSHPLSAVFSELVFEPTPAGNRGTWEQIVELGDTVNGEMIFPLGQSGHLEGSILGGVTEIDPHNFDLSPIWGAWRFLPMLHVGEDLEAAGTPDPDGDGTWDAFERWYYGTNKAPADSDGDKSKLANEFANGTDPTDNDTDDDGVFDGRDSDGQDPSVIGFIKLSGKLKLDFSTPNVDTLKISAKAGTGGPTATLDPATEAVTLTLRDDDGDVYTATLPAGTMDVVKPGLFKYKDKTGSIDGLAQLQIKLGKDGKAFSSIKVKTAKTDLQPLTISTRDVEVEITSDADVIFADTREWTRKDAKNWQVK